MWCGMPFLKSRVNFPNKKYLENFILSDPPQQTTEFHFLSANIPLVTNVFKCHPPKRQRQNSLESIFDVDKTVPNLPSVAELKPYAFYVVDESKFVD
ncbi:hypothetical protein CEXT_373381 [Caerostris extrusa]|uniref:Uncharacterized protein n=1 Tax=Caerostris extrusa TaxID=172846 RepID=A0AAV4S9D5_CAEEX|nr:hypothetical protein CEXT_373381 [Caerostris extrusa]